MAAADAWPLSAASTLLLRDAGATGTDLLRLTLKELILRRVWRLDRREKAGAFGFGRSELAIARGTQRPPALTPVMELDAALGAAVGPESVELAKAVKRLRRERSDLGRFLLDVTRADLAARGLATVRRDRVLKLVPRTRLEPTAEGIRLQTRSVQVDDALRATVKARGEANGLEGVVAAAGVLVLFAGPTEMAAIDELLRERSGGDTAGAAPVGGGVDDGSDLDLSDLSALDAFDPGIDAAVDSGGGGGGGDGSGGGDGGGGDGGG